MSGPAPGEDGVLAGTYHVQLRAVFGTVSGRLVFTDNQGGVMTCTGGDWFLFSMAR